MSVVIVGGNERMAAQYEEICRCYGCKAKVFCKENGSLKRKMGVPDLLILFTNTVSHKMVISAMGEAKRNRIPVARTHSASSAALHEVGAVNGHDMTTEAAFAKLYYLLSRSDDPEWVKGQLGRDLRGELTE